MNTNEGKPGFGVLGVGAYLPARVVTNAEIAAASGTTEEWILEKTGVEQRHRCADDELAADIAAEAGRHALKDSARHMKTAKAAEAPEMLVVATSTPDRIVPAPVFDVHARMGLHPIPALNLDAACAGVAQGMITAYTYFLAGIAESALVVGAHRSGVFFDETNRRTAPLFGDGAGAFHMGAVPAGYGILGFKMLTDSAHTEALRTPIRGGENEHVEMNGRALVDIFTRELPKMIFDTLAEAELTVEDIDRFVLHQANIRMVEMFGAAMGLAPDQVATSGRTVGNTAAASLPISVAMMAEERPFERGDIVVLATAGAGVNGAVIVLRWY